MAMILDSDLEDESEEEEEAPQVPAISSAVEAESAPTATAAAEVGATSAEGGAEAAAAPREEPGGTSAQAEAAPSAEPGGPPPQAEVVSSPDAEPAQTPVAAAEAQAPTEEAAPVPPAADAVPEPAPVSPAQGTAAAGGAPDLPAKGAAAPEVEPEPATAKAMPESASAAPSIEVPTPLSPQERLLAHSPSAQKASPAAKQKKLANTAPAGSFKVKESASPSTTAHPSMHKSMSATFTPDNYGVADNTFLNSMSRHRSLPKPIFAQKLPNPMFVYNENPAPGSYKSVDGSTHSKYPANLGYSMPIERRFKNQKIQQRPEPGHYDTAKFERFKYKNLPTGSFGSAPRGRPNPVRQFGPGPGTYEVRENVAKEGKMFSIQGRFRKRGVLEKNAPGPGAYNPKTVLCEPMLPKVGFGTTTREDYIRKQSDTNPGPGTYDMQNMMSMGRDTAKFSITSRRQQHDLRGYLDPGPGFYNLATSFGY